jgi:hypothetical protein
MRADAWHFLVSTSRINRIQRQGDFDELAGGFDGKVRRHKEEGRNGSRRCQAAGVGAFDFGDEEIGEVADAVEGRGIREGLVDSVVLEIGEGAPSDEVGRQTAFAVAGKNGFKLPKVIGGVERVRKMSSPAKLKPSGKWLVSEMEGEEVLKIVKGKKEVGQGGGLAPVVGGASVIVAVVEVEVGPDADGDFFVLFADSAVAPPESRKFARLSDGVWRGEYP